MQLPPTKLSGKHVRSLDGVRGVAILLVLCHHFSASLLPEPTRPLHIIHSLLYFGWTGVNLFFVLSGFLITGILLDTKEAPNYFRAFYARRILRICPLYYAVLVGIFLFSHTQFGSHFNSALPFPSERPLYYVYLSNWEWTDRANIVGHFWSLAVEEQFYLMWPLVVWLIPTKRILSVCIAGICVASGLRFILTSVHADQSRFLHGTFTVGMDALLAGAAIAYIVREPRLAERAKPWIYSVGAISLMTLMVTAVHARSLLPFGWRCCWFFTCLSGIYATVVFHVFRTSNKITAIQTTMGSGVLTSFGKYSYGIYVYHVPILVLTLMLFGEQLQLGVNLRNSILAAAVVLIASYVVAVLSYDYFEAKFLNLKRYFEPRLEGAARPQEHKDVPASVVD